MKKLEDPIEIDDKNDSESPVIVDEIKKKVKVPTGPPVEI